MKTIVIAALLSALGVLIYATTANAQSAEVKLTEKVKVLFPQQPVKQANGPAELYLIKLADSTANFLAVVSDLQKSNGLDAGTIAVAMLESSFWDDATKGFMAQMGADAKELGRQMKDINGHEVMQLEIERPTEKGAKNIITVFILVDGIYSVNLIHTNRGGKADENLKKAFFESLVIK